MWKIRPNYVKNRLPRWGDLPKMRRSQKRKLSDGVGSNVQYPADSFATPFSGGSFLMSFMAWHIMRRLPKPVLCALMVFALVVLARA
jgi:hypothetical protein